MDTKKLTRTAGNLDTLAKVGGCLFKAAGVICLVFAALVFILEENILADISLNLDLGFLKIYLTDEYAELTPALKLYMLVCLVSAALVCWIYGYALTLIRRILDPMKQGRPFEDNIPSVLRRIAWLVIIGGTLTQVLNIVVQTLSMKAVPMEAVFFSPAVDHIEAVFDYDLNYVILGCVILFLSYVFQYGRMLQVESDETL